TRPTATVHTLALALRSRPSRHLILFLLILPPPPISTLFPYTTLFRSSRRIPRDVPLYPSPVAFSPDHKLMALEMAPGLLHLKEVDRKSTRLNSSHVSISYAVFCLKKKNKECTRLLIIHNKTLDYHACS